MKININCPVCNNNLIIEIKNNQVIYIVTGFKVETEQNKINEILKQHGIEIG